MSKNKNITIKKLGKILKELREEKGLSLNLFAYENDLSTATVSRVENGLVDVKISTLLKFAQILDIPIHDILEKVSLNNNENIEDEIL